MSEEVNIQNTVKIDGKDYEIATLPDIAKVAIEHLMAIDKDVQRLEMARAGFAQAIKSVMEGDDAPAPVGGEDAPMDTFVSEGDGPAATFVPEEA